VREAISDTGPILHLHEIGRQAALSIFERLIIPDLVAEELRTSGLDPVQLGIAGLTCSVVPVLAKEWQAVVQASGAPAIQPADAQVFALAQASQLQQPVLTDDLTLRRYLEAHVFRRISPPLPTRKVLFSHIAWSTMRVTYDAEVDALYIRFLETTITTKHLTEGIAADYDAWYRRLRRR
jgi:predicted nucleic acid-binding protein